MDIGGMPIPRPMWNGAAQVATRYLQARRGWHQGQQEARGHEGNGWTLAMWLLLGLFNPQESEFNSLKVCRPNQRNFSTNIDYIRHQRYGLNQQKGDSTNKHGDLTHQNHGILSPSPPLCCGGGVVLSPSPPCGVVGVWYCVYICIYIYIIYILYIYYIYILYI